MKFVWVVTRAGEQRLVNPTMVREVTPSWDIVVTDPVPGFDWDKLGEDVHQDGWRRLLRPSGKEIWCRESPTGCRLWWQPASTASRDGALHVDITMNMGEFYAKSIS